MPNMQEMNQDKSSIPLFRQWKHWYWFILLTLLLEIIFFLMLTNRFS